MNNLIKAKFLFKERNELVSDKEYEPLSVTSMEQFQDYLMQRYLRLMIIEKSLQKRYSFKFQISRRGSSGVSVYDGCVSGVNHVIFSDKILPKFSHYFIKSKYFMDQYYIHGKGIHDDI